MSTYLDLQTRIADEIVRSDLTTQIRSTILTAISEFDTERWYFNETSFNVSMISGTRDYSSTNITNTFQIDAVKMTIATGTVYLLQEKPFWFIESITSGSTPVDSGQPVFYAYFNQTLSFFPIPDSSTYVAKVIGAESLTPLSADADTNAWTNDAESLIRARAKYHLYKHVIKDDQQADAQNDTVSMLYSTMRNRTTDRASTGKIRSTRF